MSKYGRLALSTAALAAALAIAGGSSAETPPSPEQEWSVSTKTLALDGGASFTAVLHATSAVANSHWIASTDGSGMFYPEDRKRLVGELAAAHRLVVQTTRYQGGPIEAVFELGEVTAPTNQALKACT